MSAQHQHFYEAWPLIFVCSATLLQKNAKWMKLHSPWPPLRPSPLTLTCFPIDGEDYDEVGVDEGQEKKFEVFKRNLNENLTTYHVCGLAHRSTGQPKTDL